MEEVKWIKISVGIFDDEKILLIEHLPDAYAIITCWFKLLCLAGKQNNGGVFMLTDSMPYTDEMLATIFRMPLNTVRLALETFERFDMIETVSGVVTIPKWEKHQSLDRLEQIQEQNRQRVRRFRERQKQKLLDEGNVTEHNGVTVCNGGDIDTDIEKETDIEKVKRGVFQEFAGEDKGLLKALREFNDFRNKKKKPMTDGAKERLCSKLEKYPREEWIAILQQSIDKGWIDVYPISGPAQKSKDLKYTDSAGFRNAISDLING